MSLNALNTSTAGLQVTQAAIGLVSQNVANAGTAGYVKRSLTSVSTLGNSGVATGTISRTLDAVSLKQLRLETAGAAYTGLSAKVQGQLDALYGNPGSGSALDGVDEHLHQSLQALTTDPTSAASRATAVSAARTVATTISGIARGVQDLRSGLESQLGGDVASASTASHPDRGSERQDRRRPEERCGTADLLDRRDQAINTLSQYLDVQVSDQPDGSVTLLTASVRPWSDHGAAASLAFDGRGSLSPEGVYSPSGHEGRRHRDGDDAGRCIESISSPQARSAPARSPPRSRCATTPCPGAAPARLLASGLSRAVSDRPATGTAASANGLTGFDIDLTGLQAGNAGDARRAQRAGVGRNLILMPTTGAAPDPDRPQAHRRPDRARGAGRHLGRGFDARAADRRRAATEFTVTGTPGGGGGSVRILSDPAGLALTGASASVTVPTRASDTKTAAASSPCSSMAGPARVHRLVRGRFAPDRLFPAPRRQSGGDRRLVPLVDYAHHRVGDTARPRTLVER